MSSDDNYLKLLAKLTSIEATQKALSTQIESTRLDAREDHRELREELKDHRREVREEMAGINKQIAELHKEDGRQNNLLAEHIQGVKSNRARLDNERKIREAQLETLQKQSSVLDKRLEHLENKKLLIAQWFSINKKVLLIVGSCAGALVAILKLLALF